MATHTTLPGYLRLFTGRQEKAHREQVVARIQRGDTSGHETAKHGYPTGNYFCWTLTACCSPHARRVTKAIFYIRGFSRFVTSPIARTAHVQVASEAIPWQLNFLEPLQLYNQSLLEMI
jgi:hypothetical protein